LPDRRNPVTTHELAALVRELRTAQQAFFRSASGSAEKAAALRRSYELEARVDRAVAEVLDDRTPLFRAERGGG
jgi:hypothetical protein